jgi:hypothetical protein
MEGRLLRTEIFTILQYVLDFRTICKTWVLKGNSEDGDSSDDEMAGVEGGVGKLNPTSPNFIADISECED